MQCDNSRSEEPHRHRGKSSESMVDKEAILKELDISAGQVILDAGCGNGYMAKEFSKMLDGTGKVYALDPDEEAIEVLQNETKGSNIEAMVADITEQTAIEGESVDLIYMSTVFHGIAKDKLRDLNRELNRLLKGGGRLAILEINKGATPFGPPMHIRYSPEELKSAVELRAGKLVAVGDHFYMQLFEKVL